MLAVASPTAASSGAEVGCLCGLSVLVQRNAQSELSAVCAGECFGTVSDPLDVFLLTLEEALFLAAERGVLTVEAPSDGGSRADAGRAAASVDALFWYGCAAAIGFPRRYAAYRHLRLKGWVVRPDAVKFGADFLLYDGPVDKCHAQYAVILADAGMQWKEVLLGSRLAQIVAKELLLVLPTRAGAALAAPEPRPGTTSLSSFLRSPEASVIEVVARQWLPRSG
mmetsp:Transcript_92843/g.277004  ORF Transcript_92843/g.277004 Transcript_92843/m.277004 type:complete len:224 (+) Transcript_92843:67-738(+)